MDMTEPERMSLEGLRGELRLDESMRRHTSWRAGGAAERTYRPADLEDLCAFLRALPDSEPVMLVGLGSNLLVRDGGLRGTVVFTHPALQRMQFMRHAGEEAMLYVEAGVASPKAARFAAVHGHEGAEFLAGVPGTIGGALAMNAGCYGKETWEIVSGVLTIDRRGQRHERTAADFHIGYRTVSPVPPRQEYFAAAWLKLPVGDGDWSRLRMKELLQRRISSQPLAQPNAGSVFRNPPGDYAARLIESCGLKGFRIGDAMVSPKHANFIVNLGTARAGDIEALIEHVQNTVAKLRGVTLEREVQIVGEV